MLKLTVAALLGAAIAIAAMLYFSEPPASEKPETVAADSERDHEARSASPVESARLVEAPEPTAAGTVSDDEPTEPVEEERPKEPAPEVPEEPIVGSYWEEFFEEHDLYWGPFPGAYDGYRFPRGNKKIDPYIEDPLFNPRGIRLDPDQRDDLQRIVTEASEEIKAARNAILKEYSQIAMATAKERGGEPPVRTPGGLKRPEPNRPGQYVTIVGVAKEDGFEKYAIRINQGEYASILDLQSKASQTKDYWISQILAYFESL